MKCLVLGQGELGWRTLQILADERAFDEILAVDVNARLVGRANMARYAAALLGRPTTIRFQAVDALDVGSMAGLLREFRPDIVVNTASMQSWHVILRLPRDIWEVVHSAGLGVWLPAHLAPAYTLMTALRDAELTPPVVNMAFADATNVALANVGLSPAVGAGNIEELVPPLAFAVAQERGVPVGHVKVRMVGHHWVNAAVLEGRRTSDIPLICRIAVDGVDITDQVDVPRLLLAGTENFPPGFEDTWLIAASAAQKALALVGHEPIEAHAPGPNGLVGGYPICLHNGKVDVLLPEGVSEDDALKVNLEGQRLDGIESITAAGDVILTEHARSVIHDVFGWDYERYELSSIVEAAHEVTSRYREFAEKYSAG